jgi:hypothetical protein
MGVERERKREREKKVNKKTSVEGKKKGKKSPLIDIEWSDIFSRPFLIYILQRCSHFSTLMEKKS